MRLGTEEGNVESCPNPQSATCPEPAERVRNPHSIIRRISILVILAAVVLFAGHYGLNLARARRGPVAGRIGATRGRVYLGEGQGFDAEGIPRPPDAERVGAVGAVGEDANATVHYFSRSTVPAVMQYYRLRMPELGWRERRDLDTYVEELGMPMLFFRSNDAGNSCIIAISEAEGGTSVTVMRQGRE